MLEKFLNLYNQNSQMLNLLDDISQGKDISIFDVNLGLKSLIISSTKKPVIYITESFDLINKLKTQFESLNLKVATILDVDLDFKIAGYKNNQEVSEIIKIYNGIIDNSYDVILAVPKILFLRLPSISIFKDNILNFKIGKTFELKEVVKKLISCGYNKVDMVEQKGQFSLRGDILDIYSQNEDLPVRIEFFGEEIDNISTFNITSYSKIKNIKDIVIIPNNLIFIDNKSQIIERLDNDYNNIKSKLNIDDSLKLKTNLEEVKFRIENNNFNGIENFILPYLNYEENLLSLLPSNYLVVFDDVKQIYDKCKEVYNEGEDTFSLLIKNGECLFSHKNFLYDYSKIFDIQKQKISFQNINTSNRIFNAQNVYSFQTNALTNYYGKYDLLKEELNYYLEFKNTVLIYAKDSSAATYLKKFLDSKNFESLLISSEEQIEKQKVNIITKNLVYGTNIVEDKFVIIGTSELLGKQENLAKTQKSKREVFTLPKIGDYVVHDIYGIGQCIGIERRKFASFEKDYIVLQYAGNDKVYVPTEQVGLISSYVSSGETQKLSKIGTQEFLKVKEKVKSSIKEMAFSLLKLYAEREQQKGFKYQDDDELMKSFENTFQFEETQDQLDAIKAIKEDMVNGKLMDRLVCGDVGYGKTEVALRAIFRAVMSGKQVAFLAPTTILSQQHFNTCFARMNNFMVRVEVLNRFKSAKEQKEILKRLKDGEIDVIIGTHRLLSKDVEFKNLGLLVLDEEQRFGVQDKEKIKHLKTDIDVLTLSATPIPRTLHMSLSGIRDISLITTPPEGRLPVQTTITEFSDILLKEVLTKELNRGGQAIVVYNSIEHIYSLAETIRILFGNNVSIGVAHGQMDEKTLENAIYDLYNGKTQILVSTTLIENGIDLPNCNTLIVKDADRLGLSQLYQLRGRVGRGNKLGYAYFTYEKNKVMTEEAYKRLNALMEFTELGSGFKIALRDLEIRGCGNVMGKEQHGHMDKVGYDMYCKLLNEAVKELKGEKVENEKQVKIDISLNAYIPDDYIVESDARFRVYNMFIGIKSEEDRQKIIQNVKEIYGKNMPIEIENLTKISLLRHYCQKLNISRVQLNSQNSKLEFYDKQSMLNEKISKSLHDLNFDYVLNFTSLPIIDFKLNDLSISKKIDLILDFLATCLN